MTSRFIKYMCIFMIAVITSLLIIYGTMHIAEGIIAERMIWRYIRTIGLVFLLNFASAVVLCFKHRFSATVASAILMASAYICSKQNFDTLMLFSIAIAIISLIATLGSILEDTTRKKKVDLPKA